MICLLIGLLCILSFLFAAYFFPFIVAFAAFHAADASGIGNAEAALLGVIFGLLAEWILMLLLSRQQRPIAQLVLALAYVAPAGFAAATLVGLFAQDATNELTRSGLPLLGGLLVAVSTYAQLSWTADGLQPAVRRS
jgi:hypothetical protein